MSPFERLTAQVGLDKGLGLPNKLLQILALTQILKLPSIYIETIEYILMMQVSLMPFS